MSVRISPPRGTARPTSASPRALQSYSWPSPSLGLVANGNIAAPQPGTAYVLENWRCTATGVAIRRGKEKNATIDTPVKALFAYQAGTVAKHFASSDTAIYDITTVADPDDVITGTGAHSCTSGKWVVIQTQASDGSTYLRGVNGTDTPFLYDGTSFATSPALTFASPDGSKDPSVLSYVWSHKQRLYFIEKETLDAWYLPVGQISGELVKFSLGGLFKLGGTLVMGSTWSRDTGSGLNAMCAFFSSEGEVAIYQGDNPGDIASWSLVGVFRAGKPLGPKSMMDAGGDLLIATDIGFPPLSRALDTDFAILGSAALSESIIDLWNQEVDLRSADWNVAFWSRQQMVVVALPTVNDQPPKWLICNAKTKAWSVYSGWSATCLSVFDDWLFFGDEDGKIFRAETTGLDDGRAYTATCLPSFDQMGTPGYKTVSMLRAVFRGPNPVRAKVVDRSDYDVTIPPAPPASPVSSSSTWGDAEWGSSDWAKAGIERRVFQQWKSAYGGGEVHAPLVMVTSGANVPLDDELIRIDGVFTPGEVVV